MLLLIVAVQSRMPDLPPWILRPSWFPHFGKAFWHFVYQHQGAGLFGVIFAEELGIPLPAPGDVAIAWGGYLTTTGAIPLYQAYIAVVAGAVTGSLLLFTLSRHYGHPFLVRFGRYIGLDQERLDRAERAFRRWGPWAIIVGRHIPGMRIVLSSFAGAFEVPYRIFVPCVFISSTIWAAIFLEVGRHLGRQSRFLFRLFPAHLLPPLFMILILISIVVVAFERGWRPHRRRAKARRAESSRAAADPTNQAPTRS
jgi:membrane protein DedA with SNARE-associated domain